MVLKIRHIDFIRSAGIILVFTLASAGAFAQSLEDLRNERLKQLEEIEYTEKLYILNRQINSREKVLNNLVNQIAYLERNISNNEKEVELLSKEVASLKDEYAKMIYRAFLTSSSYNKAQYILAARDFNQAYKRLKYLQHLN